MKWQSPNNSTNNVYAAEISHRIFCLSFSIGLALRKAVLSCQSRPSPPPVIYNRCPLTLPFHRIQYFFSLYIFSSPEFFACAALSCFFFLSFSVRNFFRIAYLPFFRNIFCVHLFLCCSLSSCCVFILPLSLCVIFTAYRMPFFISQFRIRMC